MTNAALLDGFVSVRDEAAFEAVLSRYGPMVWRVCREVLRNPHDAEDAFQATFLVFVRSAGTIRNRDALGRWLYETAYRIALRAKYQAARRTAAGGAEVERAESRPEEDAEARELRPAVHDEVNRLPVKLRSAIVLCYFEGLSQDEAARQLACPLRTLKGRLSRGRELLRSRLTRRGLTVSSVLLLLLLGESCYGVHLELIESTRHACGASLARAGMLETVPARVARLVRRQARRDRAWRLSRKLVPLLLLLILGGTGANAMLTAPWDVLNPGHWTAHPLAAAATRPGDDRHGHGSACSSDDQTPALPGPPRAR